MSYKKSPDDLRKEAIAKYDNRGARLIDEIQETLKLLRFQREALQKECFDGMGYKQLAADINTLRKSKELSLAYSRLAEAEIKVNKAMKDMAEGMTPEEEKEAVVKFLKSLPPLECKALWRAVYDGISSDE